MTPPGEKHRRQRFTHPFTPLTTRARLRSLRRCLEARPPDAEALWIFGYGSLMWNPAFTPVASESGRLEGWQRRMCVWTTLARGTPDLPGLSLGLSAGGVCTGMLFRVPERNCRQALASLWRREIWTDIYQPRWVTVKGQGGRRQAITFVVNRDSGQYAGTLPQSEQIFHIAHAVGERGTCRDYLEQTVSRLETLAIREPELNELYAKVNRYDQFA